MFLRASQCWRCIGTRLEPYCAGGKSLGSPARAVGHLQYEQRRIPLPCLTMVKVLCCLAPSRRDPLGHLGERALRVGRWGKLVRLASNAGFVLYRVIGRLAGIGSTSGLQWVKGPRTASPGMNRTAFSGRRHTCRPYRCTSGKNSIRGDTAPLAASTMAMPHRTDLEMHRQPVARQRDVLVAAARGGHCRSASRSDHCGLLWPTGGEIYDGDDHGSESG